MISSLLTCPRQAASKNLTSLMIVVMTRAVVFPWIKFENGRLKLFLPLNDYTSVVSFAGNFMPL